MDADLMKKLVEGLPPKLTEHLLKRYAKVMEGRRAAPPVYESALDELYAKRDELLRSRPEFTEAQAFDKVYLDPANRELMMREKDERLLGLQGVRKLGVDRGSLPQQPGVPGVHRNTLPQDKPGTMQTEHNTGPSHYEQFQQLAKELRRVKPELTEAQAFTKVFEDSANCDLRRSYADDEQKRLHNMARM